MTFVVYWEKDKDKRGFVSYGNKQTAGFSIQKHQTKEAKKK